MGVDTTRGVKLAKPRGLPIYLAPRDQFSTVILGLAALVLLLIIGYPLLWLIFGALGLPQAGTLRYFERAVTEPSNFEPLKNTLVLGLGTGVFSVLLGVPLAWAASRTNLPLRRVITPLVALAYITPPYLTALAYIILLGPNAGYFNRLIAWLFRLRHGPINIFSMGGVVFVISLHAFAFVYFLTATALQSVDASLEQSAQILGAKRWTITRTVTLPLVAPAITGGALLAAIDSMALFGPQAFLGLPAQIVYLPTRIYGAIGNYPPRFGDASAIALFLVLLTVVGLYVQRRYLEGRSYVTVTGKAVRPERMDLGGWKWPLLLLCLVVIFLSVVAPLAVLVSAAFSKSWVHVVSPGNFTLRNFHIALFQDQVSVRGILNSFKLAIGAATLGVLLALFIAYIDLRTQLRGRRLLDYLAILPLGLPGIVLAVGMIQAFMRPPLHLYGTIWLLLVAYIARFIPLAVRGASSAIRQIDPALEEAARITGASWLHSLRTILVPMVRPGLLAAWLLVFIPALSELSATILLYSSGSETISVALFRLNDLGQFEVVAALSVFTTAIILVTSVLLHWIASRGGAVEAGTPL